VTTWDTANVYSNGESERIIAKAIKQVRPRAVHSFPYGLLTAIPAQYNIPRHRLTLLTKCNFLVADEVGTFTVGAPALLDQRNYVSYSPSWRGVRTDTPQQVNQAGLSRAAIFNQVEASLARLETNYIDLLQIHRCDLDKVPAEVTSSVLNVSIDGADTTPEPPQETMKALHDLVQAGKVRYVGASSMWTWQFQHYNHVAEKNGWTTFVSMQNRFCLTCVSLVIRSMFPPLTVRARRYREEEREMIKYCKFAGIGLIPYSVLGYGQLARPLGTTTTRGEFLNGQPWVGKAQESEDEIVRRVEKVAKDKGWLMSQVAIAWAGDVVTSPLIGISSVRAGARRG
jgi:aryl-alcohol dehydrogenase-like predicted oxidoreductase